MNSCLNQFPGNEWMGNTLRMNAARMVITEDDGDGIVSRAWEKNADIGKCCRLKLPMRKTISRNMIKKIC